MATITENPLIGFTQRTRTVRRARRSAPQRPELTTLAPRPRRRRKKETPSSRALQETPVASQLLQNIPPKPKKKPPRITRAMLMRRVKENKKAICSQFQILDGKTNAQLEELAKLRLS